MQTRKIRVANGSGSQVELIDIIGVLFANEMIDGEEAAALRVVEQWLALLRVGLGLRQASPGGLWAAITNGVLVGSIVMPTSTVGDGALFRLTELFEHFTAINRLELLRLVIAIAAGERHPANAAELAQLRQGTQILRHVMRHGRGSRQQRRAELRRGL